MWYEANKKQSVNLKINDTNVKISEGDIFELLEDKLNLSNDDIC